MNKQIAKQVLLSNANACYNAVKENGWQSEMLKESIDNIVDVIESDHPKVKLPREAGEDLEEWLKTDNIDDILEDLVCIYDSDHEAVRDWWDSTLGATYLIADTARYGWEAEPEELFYVLGPESWENRNAVHDRQCNGELDTGIHFSDEGPSPLETPDEEYSFTRAEMKKYHLDSDIFTLVPVEDSHGEA